MCETSPLLSELLGNRKYFARHFLLRLKKCLHIIDSFMKGSFQASFHMWTGSLVRMIVSLKAWSGGRLKHDYGLNLWLLSTSLRKLLLLAWWNKFLPASVHSASRCSAWKLFFLISHGRCSLTSSIVTEWGSHSGRHNPPLLSQT